MKIVLRDIGAMRFMFIVTLDLPRRRQAMRSRSYSRKCDARRFANRLAKRLRCDVVDETTEVPF